MSDQAPVGADFVYFELIDKMFREVGAERFAPDEVQMVPIVDDEDGEQLRTGVMYLYNPPTHALQIVITVRNKDLIDISEIEMFPADNSVWVDEYKNHPDPTMYMQVKTTMDLLTEKNFVVEKVMKLDLVKATTDDADYTDMISFPVALLSNPEGHSALISSSPVAP